MLTHEYLCILRVLWCALCFCTDHLVMVPINLSTLLTTFFLWTSLPFIFSSMIPFYLFIYCLSYIISVISWGPTLNEIGKLSYLLLAWVSLVSTSYATVSCTFHETQLIYDEYIVNSNISKSIFTDKRSMWIQVHCIINTHGHFPASALCMSASQTSQQCNTYWVGWLLKWWFFKNHTFLKSHPSKLFHLMKKHYMESLNKIFWYLGVAHKSWN